MADLQTSEAEFQIKVEGTHTLPYTATLKHIDTDRKQLHLKLIRPLPHEMAPGAPFEMLFALGDQRFEAPLTFLGREAYLLYRFTLPLRMKPSDRRRHKRYPFRPREKSYVMAQDATLPGYGLAGPLVNLSLGGLAFRVDRVVRLDDHLRVTPGLGFFDRGKELPVLKIRDLPKLPLFEARGTIANAWERDGEIEVGDKFGDLRESELQEIRTVLELREQMSRASSATAGPAAPKEGRPAAEAEPPSPVRRAHPAGALTPDALIRLGRRTTQVLVAMGPGEARDGLQVRLAAAGYLRQAALDSLDLALERLRSDHGPASRLLVLQVQPGAPAPLEGLRALQRELGELRELPVALVQTEGLAAETDEPLIRPLPWPGADLPAWLPILDELAGL